MRGNLAALLLIVVITGSLLGAAWVGNCSEEVKVYAMIEEKGASFEIAIFNITINGRILNETNKPVLIYEGHPGLIKFKGRGKALNWNGVEFNISGSAELLCSSEGEYLITLEIIHRPGNFILKKDSSMSGKVGEEVPEGIMESDEKVLENILGEDFRAELERNERLQSEFLRKWRESKNLSYILAYRDLSYPLKAALLTANLGKLTRAGVETYREDIIATDWYYSHYSSPGRKDLTLVFSNDSPYYGTIKVPEGPIKSPLPFVYYPGRGFNLYPVSALHWAHLYFLKGQREKGLEILKELKHFLEERVWKGLEYAEFPVWFQFQNSSIPWVSGYAQGLGAGLYALAYNWTGNNVYLRTARLLLNSFEVPLSGGGFVTYTKYGPWYLEYAYYPEELVLNGHIIALQGLYYYWKVTGDKRAHRFFIEGAQSVKNALPFFDTGNWSRYASIYNSSSEFYHRLHIKLLVWLYVKTGDETFLRYAEKWNGYLRDRGEKPENIKSLIEEMRHSP